ncbi:hypothetical protein [Flavobacterium branchiicola]|uniref:Lipoprotein n=1 Tax=Flavobacterium branchiicola TaxID=1114875 RepID=A0ABV9PJL6_9FLAO|nr:hypothetical protein [Flavobacterium branchiicola]MBS7255310.1 hypothetical protein [Flavobacterium branchiicola]
MNKKHFLIITIIVLVLTSCQEKETIKSPKTSITKKAIAKDTTKSVQTEKSRDSIACIDVVLEILTTSPSYIEGTKGLYEAVVKNGGTSIGITVEGSPNPKIDKALDYSETYDLNLHETYPDRMPTIARYTFDPSKKELYEYNTAEDSLMPIAFNKNLLLKLNKICN